jgi:hypothetical protein
MRIEVINEIHLSEKYYVRDLETVVQVTMGATRYQYIELYETIKGGNFVCR